MEQRAGGYGSFICPSQPFNDPTISTALKHPALEGQKRFISSNKKGKELYAEDKKAMPKITGRKRMRECQSSVDFRVSANQSVLLCLQCLNHRDDFLYPCKEACNQRQTCLDLHIKFTNTGKQTYEEVYKTFNYPGNCVNETINF